MGEASGQQVLPRTGAGYKLFVLTTLAKKRENRCINEILTTDGKLSLDPLVGEREKKKKLSKNNLYEYITQNPLTLRTYRVLSKRHSVKLFNRR